MALRVVHSDRSEHLLEVLAERVAERADPFQPFVLVTPNRLVERQAELFLARQLGIAAALTMKRLPALLEERIAGHEKAWLSTARLEALLRAVLLQPARLVGPELEPVRAYLGESGPAALAERRACELAARLARVINAYAHDRPELVAAWLDGDLARAETALSGVSAHGLELARWQRALLRVALTNAGSVASIAQGASLLAHAPIGAPIAVLGYSFLSRAELAALVALADTSELLVLTPNPCAEFWEDATRRAASEDAPSESTLLASWGRAARDHVAALDAVTSFTGERRFADDDESTLLGRVQASLRNRRPVAERAAHEPSRDRSITIVAAPSLRREVESVAEEIWAIVHAAATTSDPIRFPDVAVWVTARDRDLYLPHIETVFAEAHTLPWSAIDLSLAARSRAVEALLRLVTLLRSGPARATLLDVVLHPLVLARIGPAADPNVIAQRLDRLGFFFGGDQSDVPRAYADDPRAIHLDQAIERLALGAAMLGERSGEAQPFERRGERGALYFPEEIDPQSEEDLTLVALLRSLASDLRFARAARLTITEWSTFFVALADAYLAPDEEEEAELRRALAALRELGRSAATDSADEPVRISLSTACDLAARALESLPAVGGAGGAGVVVGTLAPMRAISRRVVFVLGLGEGRFPSREPDTGLDLRAGSVRPGELSPEDRDRHALLEALVSSRDRLVLSYVARDEQTGDTLAPSHVLNELIDATRGEIEERRPLLRRHEAAMVATDDPLALVRAASIPGAAAEARARMLGEAERARFTATATPLLELANSLGPDDARRGLLAMPPVGAVAPTSTQARTLRVSLADLRRFLDCPVQGAARRLLAMDTDDGARFADSEPFETDRLVHDELVRALVVSGIAAGGTPSPSTIAELARALAAHGQFPLGAFGARARDHAKLDTARVLAQLAKARPGGHTTTAFRFGAAREHARDAARALDPIALGKLPDGQVVELIGTTAPLLDGRDPLRLDLGRALSGERRSVSDLRLALHAFLDHAALAAASASLSPGEGSGTRRAPIVGKTRSLDVVLKPLPPELAKRWLLGLARAVALESHASFFPIESVLRVAHVFASGGARLDDQLEASIEHVRTKWEGGRSRFGPVRDAVRLPPPERAARLAGDRFAIFFAHLASPVPAPPRAKEKRS